MVILTRALGRSRRHCWKYGHTMQWGRSWMSFQKLGRYRTRVLQEARHQTCAGGAVAVSRETTPATGAPGVDCRWPSDSPVGSDGSFSRAPLLKASHPVRPVGLGANSGSSADGDPDGGGGWVEGRNERRCMNYSHVRLEPKMRACRSHPQGHQTPSQIRTTFARLMPDMAPRPA